MGNGKDNVVMTVSMIFSSSVIVGTTSVLALTGMVNWNQMTWRSRLSRPSQRRRSLESWSVFSRCLRSSASVQSDGVGWAGCVGRFGCCTVVQCCSVEEEGWLRADAMLAYVGVVTVVVLNGCAWVGVATAGRSFVCCSILATIELLGCCEVSEGVVVWSGGLSYWVEV